MIRRALGGISRLERRTLAGEFSNDAFDVRMAILYEEFEVDLSSRDGSSGDKETRDLSLHRIQVDHRLAVFTFAPNSDLVKESRILLISDEQEYSIRGNDRLFVSIYCAKSDFGWSDFDRDCSRRESDSSMADLVHQVGEKPVLHRCLGEFPSPITEVDSRSCPVASQSRFNRTVSSRSLLFSISKHTSSSVYPLNSRAVGTIIHASVPVLYKPGAARSY